MRGGRGSYFFVIDAFIAAALLVFTILLVFALYLYNQPSEQTFLYASDLTTFLTTTQVRDFRTAEVESLIAAGEVTNTRNTLASQVLLFHNQSKDDFATDIVNASVASIPSQLPVNVSLKNPATGAVFPIYSRLIGGTEARETHLVTRSVEYVMVSDTEIYGPMILQIEVWS